jgi:hypothetical protein
MSANTDKLEQLILYICGRVQDPKRLGMTKLQKILWYADVQHFSLTGSGISGADYVRAPRGPLCPDSRAAIDALVRRGLLIDLIPPPGSYRPRQMIALKDADLSMFTAQEISIVDRLIETISQKHTAKSISNASHGHMWQIIPDGQPMPLEAIFGETLRAPDESDLAWAAEVLPLEHAVA